MLSVCRAAGKSQIRNHALRARNNQDMSSKPELDWNDIPLVLALARCGRMREAARELRVETSTVSRRLTALEKTLGTRLFIRGPRGYEPTDAGRAFVLRAESAYGEVQSLWTTTRAEADGVHGTVRISAVDALFDYWLVHRLPELLASHPGLRIRLIADNRNLSFMRGEADLALRAGRPQGDAALVMRKLGDADFYVYGATQYADTTRANWSSLPWLGYDDDLTGTPEAGWLRDVARSANPVLQASNVGTLARACVAGLGLALLPPLVAEPHGLVRLTPQPELSREIWLLAHRDAARLRRFSVVSDWMVNLLAGQGRKFDPFTQPVKM